MITGAAGGLGRALAEEYSRSGAELLLTDVNPSRLEELLGELRERSARPVHGRVVDVCDDEAVAGLAEWVRDCCDGLDVLVNNAGIGWSASLEQSSTQTWQRLFEVNVLGAVRHVQALLPELRRCNGQVVNVSSGQAFFRLPSWGAYAVSKLALGAYSELLRAELASSGVRVTTVYPFLIATGFYADIEGSTVTARWVLRWMPKLAMQPTTVARRIRRAVDAGRAVEMVTALNWLGFAMQSTPPLARWAARLGSRLMVGGRP